MRFSAPPFPKQIRNYFNPELLIWYFMSYLRKQVRLSTHSMFCIILVNIIVNQHLFHWKSTLDYIFNCMCFTSYYYCAFDTDCDVFLGTLVALYTVWCHLFCSLNSEYIRLWNKVCIFAQTLACALLTCNITGHYC